VNVEYLTLQEVVHLHDLLCFLYRGPPEVLNQGAIESSLAQPSMAVFGVERYPTLFLKAAAYCFYLCRNHGFREGNKRIGVGAAFHFLRKNSVWPSCSPDALFDAVTRVISHECTIEELAAVLEGPVPPQ
jgi:death on curing protein